MHTLLAMFANAASFRDGQKLLSVSYKQKAQAEFKNVPNLETTYVKTGYFMDFWGLPGVKSYFQPLTICVDIQNEAAAIPGDGNTPVVMTHTTDIGKLVAASLDLEKWDPVLYTVGDKVSMNDLLHFAEEAKGKRVTNCPSLGSRLTDIIDAQAKSSRWHTTASRSCEVEP
jgi:hypothetical protein